MLIHTFILQFCDEYSMCLSLILNIRMCFGFDFFFPLTSLNGPSLEFKARVAR
jgi:hypothetical protein